MKSMKTKLCIPVSSSEKEKIKAAAGSEGLTISAYIRKCIRSYRGDDRHLKVNTIKLKDFARAIGVSLSRARRICLERKITYYMVDEEYRIGIKDVEEYLESVKNEREAVETACEPLLKIIDVAKRYNVTPQTVDNWIRKGYMPCVRIGPEGRNVRIRKQDVDCMTNIYELEDRDNVK